MSGNITEVKANERQLTNHERIKDREMQRAFEAGSSLITLPTKSRMRRAGTTRAKLEKEQSDAERVPMPSPPGQA